MCRPEVVDAVEPPEILAMRCRTSGNAAAGNDYGTNDPGYANLRAKAGDDALKAVNGAFNNSGRFGGGSNAFAAGQGVTNALSGMDY